MSLTFNQQARDRWIGEVSRRTPRGARVLDVGAGECRYRELFDHCEYRAQDFVSRQILAEITREGGYPPLMINPIDFAPLYWAEQEDRRARAAGMTSF